MRALLDINVLIALFDQAHVFNDRAHQWLESNLVSGMATCPLTENGLIRILSHPSYSKLYSLTPTEAMRRLENFLQQQDHVFWPDDLSLIDTDHFHRDRILGSKKLTDIYLLGLATKNHGKLVTFDTRIPLNTVAKAKAANLESI